MSKGGPANSNLNDRLRQKLQEDSQAIEAMTLAEQQKLAANLINGSKAAFSIIESAINEQMIHTVQSLRELLRWPLWTAMLCMIVVLSCLAFLWAGSWWARSDLTELRQRVGEARSALETLEAQTGGIRVLSRGKSHYVVLPTGTDMQTTYKCEVKGGICLKLPETR